MKQIDINTLNARLDNLQISVIGLEMKYKSLSEALFTVLKNPYGKPYKEIIRISDENFKKNILEYYKNANEYEKGLLDPIVNDYQKQ